MSVKRVTKPAFILLFVTWALVMLYPDPRLIGRSIANFTHLDIDARAVADMAAALPNDPAKIERAVLVDYVPYRFDWQTAGVPWYFPDINDVLTQKGGDCESRAILLAAILEAKHIPHRLMMSFDHIWVDYPGKVPNKLENPAVAIAGDGGSGSLLALHWPRDFNFWKEINGQVGLYWTPMPLGRKLLLVGGLLFISLWNALPVVLRRRSDGPQTLEPLTLLAPRLALPVSRALAARGHHI